MQSLSDTSLKKKAVTLSISTAVLLTIIKACTVFITGSLSVMSSMVDSLSDVVSSLITFVAIKFSDKPFNKDHRYGYGKLESVSALIQSAFIIGSASFIIYDGICHFINPIQIEQTSYGIISMIICLLITTALIMFQKSVVTKTKSLAIAADRLHYVVDVLTNSSVIISLTIIHYWQIYWLDIVNALLIAAYLLYSTLDIIYTALGEITDKELDDEIKTHIVNLAKSVKDVRGCHDFRSRISGSRIFMEMHLELDGELTLNEAHRISDIVEEKIISQYPQAQLIIHQDPYGVIEKRLDYDISNT